MLIFNYLLIATSVPIERIFSGGRDLISHRRCKLNPSSITACICLKNWWKMEQNEIS